jgi:hypothetical protein
MREWLGRGFWRPGDLSQQAMVVAMTAVFVPYWVFEATTHTYWTADTNQLPLSARGDWRPLCGEHHGRYEGLLVGASGALTLSETHELCPFNLAVGVSPDQVDLENVTVEQFSVGRKYARPLARDGLERLEADYCQKEYVPGSARNVRVNTRLEGLSSEPVLLPVWIMAYRYRDRSFRFLVNGQTGKPTGRAPTSLRKIALVVLGIALVALILLGLAVAVAGGATLMQDGTPPFPSQIAPAVAVFLQRAPHAPFDIAPDKTVRLHGGPPRLSGACDIVVYCAYSLSLRERAVRAYRWDPFIRHEHKVQEQPLDLCVGRRTSENASRYGLPVRCRPEEGRRPRLGYARRDRHFLHPTCLGPS